MPVEFNHLRKNIFTPPPPKINKLREILDRQNPTNTFVEIKLSNKALLPSSLPPSHPTPLNLKAFPQIIMALSTVLSNVIAKPPDTNFVSHNRLMPIANQLELLRTDISVTPLTSSNVVPYKSQHRQTVFNHISKREIESALEILRRLNSHFLELNECWKKAYWVRESVDKDLPSQPYESSVCGSIYTTITIIENNHGLQTKNIDENNCLKDCELTSEKLNKNILLLDVRIEALNLYIDQLNATPITPDDRQRRESTRNEINALSNYIESLYMTLGKCQLLKRKISAHKNNSRFIQNSWLYRCGDLFNNAINMPSFNITATDGTFYGGRDYKNRIKVEVMDPIALQMAQTTNAEIRARSPLHTKT